MPTKIENISKSEIQSMDLETLLVLRNRFVQMNEKWWGSEFWPDCTEEVALQKYRLVMDEYKKREIIFIPKEIDRALFGVIAKEISEGTKKVEKKVEKKEEGEQQQFTKYIKFVGVTKNEENPEHYVMGIVYEPDTEDTQGDWATAEEIRKAAWGFMESDQVYKINHDENAEIHVLESFLAPVDYEMEGEVIKAGTWMLGSRVLDMEIWKQIEDGDKTGYSMAGGAWRQKEPV